MICVSTRVRRADEVIFFFSIVFFLSLSPSFFRDANNEQFF